MNNKYPVAFLDFLKSITAKRARIAINHILEYGFVTTEELRNKYGYNHPPRAIRDVKEHGVVIEKFMVNGSDGRKIAAYRFGSFSKLNFSKLSGRTALSKQIKARLIEKYGSKDFIYCEKIDQSELQVDHRVPFEVGGEADEFDVEAFMLLSRSANRTKSWNCENCVNFQTIKKREICLSCYWAYPEKYTHIATREIRRIDLIWQGKEINAYEEIKRTAEEVGKDIQSIIKELVLEYVDSLVLKKD